MPRPKSNNFVRLLRPRINLLEMLHAADNLDDPHGVGDSNNHPDDRDQNEEAAFDEPLTIIVAKPQTFMNRSGAAVRALIDYLDLPLEHCLVVYDDMDLPFGALRLRERGSPGTHNGMRSVFASLQTDALPRLRIGISQGAPGDATSHVLGEFGPEEGEAVADLVERAAEAALLWAKEGAPAAMNRSNSLRT